MESKEKFLACVKTAVQKFTGIEKTETIKLVSHLDCDGLTSCSIAIKALNSENRRYAVSILQQLDKSAITELAKEPYKYYLITDLGSGHLRFLNSMMPDKTIFVLDHHIPETTESFQNIVHVNPHLFGLDGNSEVSAAGVAYLFAININKSLESIAHLAIIGATGDMQEKKGFIGLNNDILGSAIRNGKIEVSRGLRIFGRQTRALHKVLEYCSDPYIPTVTGSESGAIQFLYNIGIEPRNSNGWKKPVHLTEEEMQRLVTGIIMLRMNEISPDDVLGNIYTLREERVESPLREVKEFATLLNACGRLNKPSLGIGACIGDESMKNTAIEVMNEYKKELVNAMRWFEENRNSGQIISGENYLIINAENYVLSTIIGTLASMVCKSSYVRDGTYILAMAEQSRGKIKASLRISNSRANGNIDLREILKEIVADAEDCEFGGHESAAGAILSLEKKIMFIERAKTILGKRAIEERVD